MHLFKKSEDKNTKQRIAGNHFIEFVVFFIICWTMVKIQQRTNICISEFCKWYEGNELELFLGQTSLTFLTVSVLSILSDNSRYIYWENIVEKQLISPPFRNFYAYCMYSFTALAFSLWSLVFREEELLGVYFVISLVILTIFALKMINVYRDDNTYCRKIEKEFEKYITNNEVDVIEEKFSVLHQKTMMALYGKDLKTVDRNLEFYKKYRSSFGGNPNKLLEILDFYTKDTSDAVFEIIKLCLKENDRGLELLPNCILHPSVIKKLYKEDIYEDIVARNIREIMHIALANEFDYVMKQIGAECVIKDLPYKPIEDGILFKKEIEKGKEALIQAETEALHEKMEYVYWAILNNVHNLMYEMPIESLAGALYSELLPYKEFIGIFASSLAFDYEGEQCILNLIEKGELLKDYANLYKDFYCDSTKDKELIEKIEKLSNVKTY